MQNEMVIIYVTKSPFFSLLTSNKFYKNRTFKDEANKKEKSDKTNLCFSCFWKMKISFKQKKNC